MDIHEYVTNPDTGTVHLVRSGDPTATKVARCGYTVKPNWLIGEETTSGLVASCNRCRTAVGLERAF